MSCSIIRKNGEIDKVLTPNGNESLLFKSMSDFEVSKEEALKLWAKAYTPSFKQWFGYDWENVSLKKDLVNEALSLPRKDNLYMLELPKNPELILKNIAEQFNSGNPQQVEEAFGRRMMEIALELFPNANIETIDQNGEPRVILDENDVPVFINSKGETKSIYNRGSFLTADNSVTLDIKTNDSELFNAEIFDNNISVGGLSAVNDGAYLTIEAISIDKQGQNIGTNAYLKMAEFAIENGLQLRSDVISTRMSDAAIATWNRFVATGQAEIQEDRYVFTGNPKEVTDNVFYNLENNSIKYKLKSIEILSSQKAIDTFNKGKLNNWSLDKILSELHIPKEQKALIQALELTDREEITIQLASQYSYAIEINRGKDKTLNYGENYDDNDSNYFVHNEWTYEYSPDSYEGKQYFKVNEIDTNNNYVTPEDYVYITKEEFEEAKKQFKPEVYENYSSHYSNMIVPGGANYEENEIATPVITPSIKGHAQFATDNGIGWFRSDKQISVNVNNLYHRKQAMINAGLNEEEIKGILNEEGYFENIGEISKTRRILELQSDLFQKGRDREVLTTSIADRENAEAAGMIATRNSNPEANAFLQLLNKDNNWVTFFVKSIIQDSAKKGYEKVLFPKGDTAAKVEGHETIEEFIKSKQSSIEEIKKQQADIDYDKKWINKYNSLKEDINMTSSNIELAEDNGKNTEGLEMQLAFDKSLLERFLSNPKEDEIKAMRQVDEDKLNRTINQFEKEIEDAKAGKLKISTIANFYEITVKNVLSKIGQVETITDEYGNSWYEVNLSDSKLKEQTDNILFNLKLQGQYSQIPSVVLSNLTKNGLIGKFNPNKESFEDRWYFNQSIGLENSQQRYHQYMSMNNLNQKMFKEGVSKNGIPYIIPNDSFDLTDSIEENNERIHKDKYNAIITFFKDKFNIDEKRINYITKAEFAKRFPEIYKENAQSVYYKGNFYFFTNNLTADITVEELLHPFIFTVKELNKDLFNNLLREAQKNYPLLAQKIQSLYSSQPQSIRDQELVTQALSRVFNNVHENEEPKSLIEVLKDFVYWIKETFNDILSYFDTGKVINLDIDGLSPQLNLEQIAQIINATDTKFDLIFPEGSFYNLSEQPEDFNAVVATLLSDKRVEVKVEQILVKIPDALKAIKKRLDSSINKNEKQELQSVISQIEELVGEDKSSLLKAQMKGIITTIQLFNTLQNELNTIDRSDMNSSLKLSYYMSMHKTMESLEGFKGLMLELNDELSTNLRQINNPNVERFYLLLNKSLNVKDNIQYKLQKLILSPLLEQLTQSNEHTYSIPLNNIEKQIDEQEDKLSKTNSLKEKDAIQNKLVQLYKEKKGILKYAPTKENLEKVFNSQFKDANQLSYLLEAKIANGHPLVNTLQSIINNIYDDASSNMLNSKNELQTALDEYTTATGKSLRDMEKLYEGLGDNTVALPVELTFSDKGEPIFKYINQNTLTHNIDNTYITKYMELEMLKKHHYDLHIQDLTNNIKDSKNTQNYKQAFEDFEKFKKENTQKQYVEDYYTFRAMLDEKVGDKTVRQITNDLYDEIERVEDALLRADSTNREYLSNQLKISRIELKKLRSDYNDDGSKKDEDGLKIASILNNYTKLRYEYGDNVLTEDGKTKYEFDLEALEFKKDQYHPNDFKKLKDNLQQKIISQDYFNAVSSITEDINSLSNQLIDSANNSDIAKYITSDKLKEKKKDIYKEIRDITKPYRDEDQIIDGITLTAQNPDLVKRIKDLQQYIEDLKLDTFKFTSLSPKESNEYTRLRKIVAKTIEEQNQFNALEQKKGVLNRFKKENLAIIEGLNALFSELGSLSSTVSTEYYDKIVDSKLEVLRANESIKNEATEFVDKNKLIELNGIVYFKEDGKWYFKQKINKKTQKVFLGDLNIPSSTGHKEIVDLTISYIANLNLESTQWWKDNHYTQYIFNKKTFSYEPKSRALYIWEQQIPNNPNFIETLPNRSYYTYQVKDIHINPDFGMLYKNIPLAKPGKFVSKKYQDIQKDPTKYKFLTILQNKYNEGQEFLPEGSKMGPVLPSIIKTSGENAVNVTNKLLSFDGTFKEMFATNSGETDTDTSYLVGGSQSNTKTIPIRFTGKMDTKNQSKNLVGSILLFEYHSSLYNALNKSLSIFEASQLLAGKVETLENKNSIDRLSIFGKIRKTFSPSKTKEEETRKKEIEKTILSKTIDSTLDIFVYGQKIKPEVVNFGPVGNVDLAKVSSTVLGFAAKSIFIGNIISAINNSVSTRLQAIVNSGVKSKLYSLNNLKNAQVLSVKYGKDLLSDWTKLGNKSLIGQVLDHFSFLAENPSREITSKSEFTYLKNKTEFLTSPKQMSEFEVLFIQFLTIADATSVKVNGKDVKLSKIEDIFELKDGKFSIKKEVEFDKKDQEIFRAKYQSMARKLAGAYRGTEQSSIEANWAGKSAMFLRRFFVSMATNRFAGERWNTQEQEVQIGYQRETFKNMIKLFQDWQHLGVQEWSKMTDKEKASFYKTLLEYGTLMLMIGLLAITGGNDDKKKLKENSFAYNMMLVSLYRAKTEMEQFTLKGTDDLIRMGKNPFMVFTTIGNIAKITGLVVPTVFGSDVAFYQQNTGLHKKGDSKLVATFLKTVGYTGATFHPEEYLVNFRNAQNR